MNEIKGLNRILTISNSDEIETIIEELNGREEFACTGNSCPVNACNIVGIDEILNP